MVCPLGTERVYGVRTSGEHPDFPGKREYNEDTDDEHQHQRGGEQDGHLAAGERGQRETETDEIDQVREEYIFLRIER